MAIMKRVEEVVFSVLEAHPDGIRWSELLKEVKKIDESLHPKTVNGFVWQLPNKFSNQVYKPSKGVFKLKKFD